MAHSDSTRPDLDWSQVRETIKLLTVAVAQMDGSMKAGDDSVNALANSFTSIVSDMNNIQRLLSHVEPNSELTEALMHLAASQEKITASIVAFQFYDRLQQCLAHVSQNLKDLSAIIETPQRLYNPAEWAKLQGDIRGRYTMEAEKVMFDAIHQGKSIDEALQLFEQESNRVDDDDIQLF